MTNRSVRSVTKLIMKYSTSAARMFATGYTRIVNAGVAVVDTLFFRRRLKRQLRIMTARYNAAYESMESAEIAREKDEMSARAQLLALRVNPESVRGRTGFMISAFVPSDALTRLQKSPDAAKIAFRDRIVSVLVEHALKGLFRVTSHGTMHDIIFEPLGSKSNKRIASGVFETKDGKHKVVHPPANSLDVRMIQDAQSRGETQ